MRKHFIEIKCSKVEMIIQQLQDPGLWVRIKQVQYDVITPIFYK